MIQGGERVAAGSPRLRLASCLRYRLGLIMAEVAVGSPDLARVGLIAVALALQTIVYFSPGHFRPAGNALFASIVAFGTLGALLVMLLATIRQKSFLTLTHRRSIGAGGLLILLLLSGIGAWQTVTVVNVLTSTAPYNNDGAVMDLYAARRVLQGHNPYLRTNIATALAAINAPSTTTTPLMDGQFRGARAYPSVAAVQDAFNQDLRLRPRTIPPDFESKYNYPAGSFLFILPFVWAGVDGLRFLYLLAIVGMGVYLWKRMPRPLRPLAPLLILSNVPLLILARGGQPDPVYGLFLMVGFAEWTSPWLSPLALGVALGTKQVAWFFLPFYLILVVRQFGMREAARRAAIMASIFLALNGPFIAHSPAAYLSSITGPMTDPMFPLGVGIIALFVANVLPMIPKLAFTVTEMTVWTASGVAFWRSGRLTAASAMVLGALPLVFAWRSLVNYFYLIPILALAVYFRRRESANEVNL